MQSSNSWSYLDDFSNYPLLFWYFEQLRSCNNWIDKSKSKSIEMLAYYFYLTCLLIIREYRSCEDWNLLMNSSTRLVSFWLILIPMFYSFNWLTGVSAPKTINDFTSRLSANLSHFQANYIIFGLVSILYSLLTNLWLLFAVAYIGVGVLLVSSMSQNEPTSIFGGRLTFTQSQAWMGLAVSGLLVLWLTAAGSSIFWVGCFVATIVMIHAGFMEKPIENDFEEEV